MEQNDKELLTEEQKAFNEKVIRELLELKAHLAGYVISDNPLHTKDGDIPQISLRTNKVRYCIVNKHTYIYIEDILVPLDLYYKDTRTFIKKFFEAPCKLIDELIHEKAVAKTVATRYDALLRVY